MTVLRETIPMLMGQQRPWDEERCFFYITDDETSSAAEVVAQCPVPCNQENLHAQFKDGMRAAQAPVNTLLADDAYNLMASLAWTAKAWLALSVPIEKRFSQVNKHQQQRLLRMEFRTFINLLIKMPAPIARKPRKVVLRVRSYNRMSELFIRLAAHLHI